MKKFIRVDEWKPKKEDKKINYSGNLMIIEFDKIFNQLNNNSLNTFVISKKSYFKQAPLLCHYINYFIKFYDEDNELLMSYAKLKYIIDDKSNKISLDAFIQILYDIMFTDSLIRKIIQMTEDNYYIELSSPETQIRYNESLEFTTEHAKIIMRISTAIKLMVPVVFHYLSSTYGKLDKKDFTIFKIYIHLFDIFDEGVDIYNKLYVSISSRVSINNARNQLIWNQREILGVVPINKIDELLKDCIISENMFKYVFDKNLVNYNHVTLDKQLGFFLKEQYNENRIEINDKKDSTGLTGLDKLEMNSYKIDESTVILSNVSIKYTIKRLEKKLNIKISKDEIDYYKQNMKITKFQAQLVFYYYAKYFNGYRDLNLLSGRQFIKLVIMLKKILQYQGFIYLPQIISSNIEGKLNVRTIQNNKFLTKIETTSLYQSIIENKYSLIKDMDKIDKIMNLLSTLLNTTFSFVDYDHKDKLGEIIEINQDMVCDEFLNLINQI